MALTLRKRTQQDPALALQALETELAELPAAIATAARTGDDDELGKLLTRERRLSVQITENKVNAVRQRIAKVEAEQTTNEAERLQVIEETRAAGEATKQAREALRASERAITALHQREEANLWRRNALAEQLVTLQAELVALGVG